MASRQVWLARVAGACASNLGAGYPGEALSLTEEEAEALPDAEYARLQWAEQEVQRRLYAMGTREVQSGE